MVIPDNMMSHMLVSDMWKKTRRNDSFCLHCFREDFPKNLPFELGLEGNVDYDWVDYKKQCFNQRE